MPCYITQSALRVEEVDGGMYLLEVMDIGGLEMW